MRAVVRTVIVLLLALLSINAWGQPAAAQKIADSTQALVTAESGGVDIYIDGRPILKVYAGVAGRTPEERAEGITGRIIAVAQNRSIPVTSIFSINHGAWTEIRANDQLIMAVTEYDADAAGRTQAELALEYCEIIKQVVTSYRENHTWKVLFRAIGYTAVATLVLAITLFGLFRVRRICADRFNRWAAEGKTSEDRFRRFTSFLVPPLLATGAVLRWILILGFFQAYLTVVLRFYPSTQYTSLKITSWLFSSISHVADQVIRYTPHLLVAVFIILITYYLVRLNALVFSEIESGKLTVRGFYPDWAEPTAKLTRLLILAAAAVIIFPYLPGSESPAFRGISVFLGVLVSLGSTSAVGNAVAGTILTYMRSFQVGDFVRIGQHQGTVLEKSLLVTRIRTLKREVVTIPNGTVMAGEVVNYSAEAGHTGVIFHTTVTIGYNAPWKIVHELLIAAANETQDILKSPPPFVLQSQLHDFYVGYELNAYTNNPNNMQQIYSDLHQNIQDRFNDAGVEICSPHYSSLRDGNRIAIPDDYISSSYQTPGFVLDRATESGAPVVEKHQGKGAGQD